MDSADLADLLDRHASRHAVPGAALGIVREGVVATAGYGVADVRTREPVTRGTLFSLGSLTKSMVATVIARLASSGMLSLDDPVSTHVPELRTAGWARIATIRDLLANRSGLPLSERLEFDFLGRTDQDDGALARLAADVAAAAPAPGFWSYTNVGWCLLGRVVETATGSTFEEAMSRDLGRIGMQDADFGQAPASKRRVVGHDVTAAGPEPQEPLTSRAYGPAGSIAAAPIGDVLRFTQLHLEAPSLADLRVVHADVSIYGWLDAWCLGWARFDWADGPVWGWDGVVNGERSVLRLLPDQHGAVVLLTNGSTGRAMGRSLLAELMGPLFGVRAPELSLDAAPGAAADLARYVGTYAWPDSRADVTVADGGLMITTNDRRMHALPIDERAFLVDAADPDNPTVTFGAFDAAGRPGVLYLMLWGLLRIDR